MSDNWNSSSTDTNSQYSQGPASGTNPEALNASQNDGGAYNELSSQPQDSSGMGGGRGAMGSGVSGGYEGNQQPQPAEKKDWLDKGITMISKKVGVNVSDKNADAAGDFMNKELQEKQGRNIPGVY